MDHLLAKTFSSPLDEAFFSARLSGSSSGMRLDSQTGDQRTTVKDAIETLILDEATPVLDTSGVLATSEEARQEKTDDGTPVSSFNNSSNIPGRDDG
ncbi:hypothetical protein M378DRAFT_12228 [Amanita muscaria Koide BX008]|uniref:Uncharacterized protein n=1 Tax=Amanita muscaria (strain Koide BX008) TaxID=946122 RepID=A0A0C2SJE9_AMAMK|nr:hypothetical protein M378DRAFT_12228 [Amanita muscaria Koide BX008]